MKTMLPALVLLAFLGDTPARVQEATTSEVRVGTYDNRAIAVAYAASRFNPVAEKMQLHKQAKQAGDLARVAELEAWGERHQRQLHRQGFARVPVDDLLEPVKTGLAEVARTQDLDLIAWSCDYAREGVQVVDVTDAVVALFEPSAKTLATVAQVREHAPVGLDEVESGHDH